ncbi:MAG: hypothetical protein UT48_C0004G0008 [Parcubacteria group bacterium GW2011_GWE2_39_37]|uniref:Type II secretion system protein GspF domain-containing protein n=1 Tax=Candidatus Falkowbacteria bacterium GW2011_GWF2_39_8 TaxID=1618642 RepID=A0A0G0T041_9BACT|nr:MAG: hypothetical protein UT48_C0004G0008 [Parcubacteria group bacterium GW2011_GWE2_39_37]KKR31177.1 MAG: hypothetical protein UT64_C0070G0005 [Candidatus Falkowbacteria bacterium GW2011_GWF2_39_8]
MSVNLTNFNQTGAEAVLVKKSENKQPGLVEKINNFLLIFSRISSSEKLFFVQNLGIMLKAGVSLLMSLRTLAKQTSSKKFVGVIEDMADNVEKGKTLTESLAPHEKIFGELFINMVEAGEISGKLESVLTQLFTQIKKQHKLVSKVKGAMTYPIVVLTAMGAIGTFMMMVVVPKLTGMLKDFGAQLPLPTQILITVSDTLVNNGPLVFAIIFVFVVVFIRVLKTYRGKYYFQALILKLPVISPIVKKINLAKFSRTISSLLKTDIMIIKSFQITANVLGNLHYRKAVNEIAEKIKKGSTINEVISQYPKLFSPIVVQMVNIGEQTGELDEILEELAQFYEEEVDQIMDTLPSILEPILILILGTTIGGMAVAIIMPMYSLSNAI